MEKKDVIEFFNRCAPTWDAEMIRSDEIINIIFDNAAIREGIDVLDVACGTGVLFPDYMARKVSSVTGIDIAPEMIKIAHNKFPQADTICGDVENYNFNEQFDAVMVYNAFPHFPDPERLIEKLAKLTKTGGRLSVAHGMSRAAIDKHHSGPASKVSVGLIDEQKMKALFEPWFDVDVVISNDSMYQVAGTRKVDFTDKKNTEVTAYGLQ